MVICVAVGCNNDSRKTKDISFYKLPTDQNLRREWLQKIKRENIRSFEHARICHTHFEDDCFQRDLQNELLQLPTRRLLKADAIPTKFSHVTVVKKKRESSEKREELVKKRQLIDESVADYEKTQIEMRENNTKETQSSPIMVETYTDMETIVTREMGTQCEQKTVDTKSTQYDLCDVQDKDESFCDLADVSLQSTDLDESYVCSSDLTSSDDEESGNLDRDDKNCDDINRFEDKSFIVSWPSLIILFAHCLTCGRTAEITKMFIRGSALVLNLTCVEKHKNIWKSQNLINRYYDGNIKFAASVLFSANTYKKIRNFFDLSKIVFLTESSFYEIQRKFLFGITNDVWLSEQAKLFNEMENSVGRMLCGDGRCDSPGHNAKYLTYTFFDQELKKIIGFTMAQCTEAGNSNRMEKFCFVNALNELEKNITIAQITTDRHIQIKKYMREERADICHQFDIWHVCKNIKTKLITATKKKSCYVLDLWRKSILNHFWWACATCNGDEVLLKEKWISILFHVQNIHIFHGNEIYKECGHDNIISEREWLNPSSEAFAALQQIVLNKNLLQDLKHLVKFSHTGTLEVYHALYNKWLPKSTHFSYLGMICRSQLAAIDFNIGADLPLSGRENLSFSKATKTWSIKPVKVPKKKTKFEEMIEKTLTIVKNGEILPTPEIPKLPKNIAPVEKPTKSDAQQNQKSRFNIPL